MRDPSQLPGLSPVVRERLDQLLDSTAAPASARRAVDDEPPVPSEAPPPEPRVRDLAWTRLTEFGKRHLAAIAILALAGLAVGGWNVLRARSVAVAPTPRAVSTAVATSSASASKPSVVLVHVVGAVHHPGVVTLSTGARVGDAVVAAGGMTEDAEPGQLNLAAVVNDGDQIVVGSHGQPGGEVRTGGGGSGDGSSGSPGTQVNLNTATQPQLEALPGVGPVTAGKILAWRTQHGRFSRVEELGEVDGIGPKTLAQIKPYVRV